MGHAGKKGEGGAIVSCISASLLFQPHLSLNLLVLSSSGCTWNAGRAWRPRETWTTCKFKRGETVIATVHAKNASQSRTNVSLI